MLNMNTGNRVHAMAVRGMDLYETPRVAVRSLLTVESPAQTVWECASGPGEIVRELRATGRTVFASDIVRYPGLPDAEQLDFLAQTEAPCSTIFTNPPFSCAEAFVAHALELAEHVYVLNRINFLEGLRWQVSRAFGQHLARTWVFTPRLPMMHRDGYPIEDRNESSGMAFAWYVFHRDWAKRTGSLPTVGWLDWREVATAEEMADIKKARSEIAAFKRQKKRDDNP